MHRRRPVDGEEVAVREAGGIPALPDGDLRRVLGQVDHRQVGEGPERHQAERREQGKTLSFPSALSAWRQPFWLAVSPPLPLKSGPCPPDGTGTHHYKFELYALDTSLGLDAKANRQQLESAMKSHTLDKTILTGLFSAKQ